MELAAAAGFAMGFVMLALSKATIDTSGIGTLFVGVAAVVSAAAGLRNGRKIDAAKTKAETAAEKAATAAEHSETAAAKSTEVAISVGPANGKTVQEILHAIANVVDKMEEDSLYQHSRNHDILSALSSMNIAIPTIVPFFERVGMSVEANTALAERLLVKLNEGTP